MKIRVFGTTLQAGVLAGLMAEFGHQVSWCLASDLPVPKAPQYQDDSVNHLILKQLTHKFLKIIALDQLLHDQDVYLFSYSPSEF